MTTKAAKVKPPTCPKCKAALPQKVIDDVARPFVRGRAKGINDLAQVMQAFHDASVKAATLSRDLEKEKQRLNGILAAAPADEEKNPADEGAQAKPRDSAKS